MVKERLTPNETTWRFPVSVLRVTPVERQPMVSPSDLSRLLHTVRYLRPVQVANRIVRTLRRSRISHQPAPPGRHRSGTWVPPAMRPGVLLRPHRLRIFQQEIELTQPADWWDPQRSRLVQYNLHYFDDLRAVDASERTDWQRQLMDRWIDENPPAAGAGWEPYPLSLRIVNWIQWCLAGNPLSPRQLDSLAQQVRCLVPQLEFHLLANHLLANLKALVFAGSFFAGDEARGWLTQGAQLYQRELQEQILADGGHFELSPMYHSLILEDLLDVFNLGQAYAGEPLLAWTSSLAEPIARMRTWLKTMCHPDGQIALFNDAAWEIAPPPRAIDDYARRLGLGAVADPAVGITPLSASGYLRVQLADYVALLDVARVGPDYQPGHAHADTLSFEWSWGTDRVLVNSGTSCYGRSAERLRQRSTSAHNTVEVDGQNSSEVWSSFRVAQRARPLDLSISEDRGRIVVTCGHDGYRRLPGRVTHRRRWVFSGQQLTLEDWLEGRFAQAVARLRLAPPWQPVRANPPGTFGFEHTGRRLTLSVDGAEGSVVGTTFHPEFDLALPCWCLETTLGRRAQRIDMAWSH